MPEGSPMRASKSENVSSNSTEHRHQSSLLALLAREFPENVRMTKGLHRLRGLGFYI